MNQSTYGRNQKAEDLTPLKGLPANSDALDFDGKGHIVFRSESDEAEAASLADELEVAGQDAVRALGERHERTGMASRRSCLPWRGSGIGEAGEGRSQSSNDSPSTGRST